MLSTGVRNIYVAPSRDSHGSLSQVIDRCVHIPGMYTAAFKSSASPEAQIINLNELVFFNELVTEQVHGPLSGC